MPRSSDPKLDVRFSSPGLAAVRAAAESIGVKPGTLVRECAERFATTLARDVSEGRVSLAARSAPVRAVAEPPVPRPAAPRTEETVIPRSGAARADLFRLAEARRVRE